MNSNLQKMNKIFFLLCMVLVFIVAPAAMQAQTPLKIGISKDAATGEFETLAQQIKSEIEALAQARGGVAFKELNAAWQADKVNENLRGLLDDPETDIIITLGFLSSDAAARLPSYPKPVIAATLLDRELEGVTLQSDSSTGIANFSYIPSMIRLFRIRAWAISPTGEPGVLPISGSFIARARPFPAGPWTVPSRYRTLAGSGGAFVGATVAQDQEKSASAAARSGMTGFIVSPPRTGTRPETGDGRKIGILPRPEYGQNESGCQ